MLQISNIVPECKLTGRELDRQLQIRGSNATQRALLANDLERPGHHRSADQAPSPAADRSLVRLSEQSRTLNAT
jgi:hypothetical protein